MHMGKTACNFHAVSIYSLAIYTHTHTRARTRTHAYVHTYRAIHNSLTHFIKSLHLNGIKDSTCDPHIEKETLQVYLYMPQVLSFVGGHQGSTLTENGSDRSREGFCCLSTHKHSQLWLCSKVFRPSLERTCRWGTASTNGMKNSSVTGACASYYAQDDRLFTGESGAYEGAFSMQPHLRPLAELGMPQPILLWILHKCLLVKPYRMQLLQTLTHDDKAHHLQFCTKMQQHLEEDSFTEKVIFNDEAMLYLHGRWIDTMYAYRKLKTYMLQLSTYRIIWNWTFSVPFPTRRCTDHFCSPSQQSLARPVLICCRNG